MAVLNGIQKAWLQVLISNANERERCKSLRKKGIFGIGVEDDYNALLYQVADYRYNRAYFALMGGITVKALVLDEDGWKDVTVSENYKFLKNSRKRGVRAKNLLKQKE